MNIKEIKKRHCIATCFFPVGKSSVMYDDPDIERLIKEVERLEDDVEHESGMASVHHRHIEHLQDMGKKNRQQIQELQIQRNHLKARIKELEKNTHLLEGS